MARKQPQVRTPEAREQQLKAMAEALAEKQLADGTATAQVIVHYLRAGTEEERLKVEKIKRENDLLKAKVEALKASKELESLFTEALNAMRTYSGADNEQL